MSCGFRVQRQAKRRCAWAHPSNSCAAALACCQRLCPGHSVASDPVLQVWLDSAGCSSYICVCISLYWHLKTNASL